MKTITREVDGVLVPLLASELIPAAFAHGFTTRAGGVSLPPYDTLNLGKNWGDEPSAVVENRRRVVEALGARELHLVTQVHGAKVARVRPDDVAAATAELWADGLCTDQPGVAVGVFVADCVPLLLADVRTGGCAAVHAGWRGVVAGIARAAIARMGEAFGTRPEDLRVAIGPSIGPCCFEVGDEVVAAFGHAFPFFHQIGAVSTPANLKPHVDLWRVLRAALVADGVSESAIDLARACTRCDPDDRFYSFRRDANRTGQQMGLIVRRGSSR